MKKLLIVIVLGVVLLLSSCIDIKTLNKDYEDYYIRYNMYSDVSLMEIYYYIDGVETVIIHESEYDFVAQELEEPFILYYMTGDLTALFVRASRSPITTVYKAGYYFYIKVSDIEIKITPTEIIGGEHATAND